MVPDGQVGIKEKILESRVNSLKLLQNKVSQLSKLPESFVSASATGYYQENTSKPQNELIHLVKIS